jgi:hypothetical protein
MKTYKFPPMPKPVEAVAVMVSGIGSTHKTPADDYYVPRQMRDYASGCLKLQSERHAQELAAYELTVSNLRAQLARVPEADFGSIKKWAEDRQDPSPSEYWNKGYEAARAWVKMQLDCMPQPVEPDAHALFWELRSKILDLPRYSFMLNKNGGVGKVADICGNWIDVYDAAGLCEYESVDAMIAAMKETL